MTSHLHLIRHAESENNFRPDNERVEDPSITPRGVRQAECLARWLAMHPFDVLVTSPFRRALQTAAPAIQLSGRPAEVWCDIYERGGCYVGYQVDDRRGASGLGRQAIAELLPTATLEEHLAEEGWWVGRDREDDDDAWQRAAAIRQKLEARFARRQGRVVLVTHAEFQRMLLGRLLGTEAAESFGRICNAGITYLTYSQNVWQLQWFNSVTHLPSDLITAAKG